jgi:hypothetical protein
VEALLVEAEALLAEWRAIEAVVPSLDAWVTLRKLLPQREVVVSQDHWTTLVAVGGGTTVRRVGDQLDLAELPVSRAVKELVELGLLDLTESAPAGAAATSAAPAAAPLPEARPPLGGEDRPLLSADDSALPPPPAPAPGPAPGPGPGPNVTRSRRNRAVAAAAAPTEPEVFVPLDLPGHGPAPSYDKEPELEGEVEADEGTVPGEVDDLAAAFPGLSNHSDADVDDAEIAEQLAQLSPRAATAIRAAAEAETDEEREAALEAVEGGEQPLNRGLLLKFLSSVKS